ncbi:MAG: dihydrofolate synthase/folylpolyglutamate synthase [Halieaceae bacterium]|jgi:dihydrofolate synthase/folylpolyglutamate synthase
MSSETLKQWLKRLELLHPSEIDLGLARVGAVAARMQLLPLSSPAISIAGTNGKGSTAAVIEAVAMSAGLRTGLCSSPHLLLFNERIRVDGKMASDADIIAAFEAIDAARVDISLTYFEFATLAALYVFRKHQVDLAVLEVGLGGRLDAVNIVDSTVAVITNIALDHQEWLGDDRDAIGGEKAGIVRMDVPVVIADREPPQGLLAVVEERGALPYFIGREFDWTDQGSMRQIALRTVSGEKLILSCDPGLAVQPENVCAGLQALALLGVALDEPWLPKVLTSIRPAGRLQCMDLGGQQVILDVAHNPAAVSKLHEYISLNPCKGKTLAIFSAMKDKDIKSIIEGTAGCFDAWFLGDQPDIKRAATARDLSSALRASGCTMISVSKNLRQAYRRARSVMEEGDRLVVFGSFHTVAAVLPALEKDIGNLVSG